MTAERVALVTGGTSGIGLAAAHALGAEGHALMVNGLGTPDEIAAAVDGLRTAHGVEVRYSGADLREPGAICEMVEETAGQLGRLDIVVNSAGTHHIESIENFPVDKWDAILAVNLSASFHISRLAIPHMRARGWGRIVNIASTHGLVASPFKVPYVAAKHGLVGLTKGLALELGDTGITCNAICPGFTDTPMFQFQADGLAETEGRPKGEIIAAQLKAKQAIAELVRPEHIGALVVYLCSDAARAITGTAIPVDGGWTAQ